jgi:hypothetical protein
MTKRTWLVHVIYKCEDCGKECESWKNGQAVAAKHAKQHGHLVRGEVGLAFEYNGRTKKAKGAK